MRKAVADSQLQIAGTGMQSMLEGPSNNAGKIIREEKKSSYVSPPCGPRSWITMLEGPSNQCWKVQVTIAGQFDFVLSVLDHKGTVQQRIRKFDLLDMLHAIVHKLPTRKTEIINQCKSLVSFSAISTLH